MPTGAGKDDSPGKDRLQSPPVDPQRTPKSSASGSKIAFAGMIRKSLTRDLADRAIHSNRSSRQPSAFGRETSAGDDPHIEALMTSLVDSSKMDKVWTKISKRVSQLEQTMERLTQPQADDDSALVTKREMKEYFETQGGDAESLQEMATEAGALERRMSSKSSQVANLANKLQQLEEANTKSLEEALAAAQKAEDVHKSLADQLKETVKKTAISIAEANAERQKKETTMSQKIREAWQSMKELEVNLQHFARKEVAKATKELLFSESSLPMTPGVGSSREATRHDSRGGFAFGLATPPSTAGSQPRPAAPTATAPASAAGDSSSAPSVPAPGAAERDGSRRDTAFAEAAREGVPGNCTGPAEWRTGLLTLVEQGLLEPLRADVLATLRRDMNRQKDDIDRRIRAAGKATDDLGAKVGRTGKDIKEERDARLLEEIKTQESITKIYAAIAKAEDQASANHEKAMNTCAELQTTADVHSEKLNLHTKDILDSATKTDAKTLSDGVAKSVAREVYKKDMGELKKIIDYHTGKLDSIGMQVSVLSSAGMSGKGKDKKSKKVKTLKKDPSAASKMSETASTGMASGEVSLQSLSESPEPHGEAAGDTPQVGGPEDQEGFEDADAAEPAAKVERSSIMSIPESPESPESPARAVAAAEPVAAAKEREVRPEEEEEEEVEEEEEEDEEEEDEEDDDDSEYSDSPGEVQLREQVQSVCLGLVCLGQHVLRGPPQCGISRQNRLLQEKDLLEELLALRQWITQRSVPPGWSPDKLISVSLRYAHPNPQEVHGPQPEMSYVLNRHSVPKQDSSRSPTRYPYPLDVETGSIGIPSSPGAHSGGGAGIMGGVFRDGTEVPLHPVALPIMEGSGSFAKSPRDRVVHKVPFSARRLMKTPSSERSQMLSARESRERMATTLPAIGITRMS